MCQRRVESNGDRFIHLTIYDRDFHRAAPDIALLIDGADPWAVEKLRLMEAPGRSL